jgi:hypothetical protein
MVKNNCLFILFFCLLGITGYAQKVSNINYRQELSTIIISYDLETKTPCKINLFVSTNGGKTWQGPLKKVTGDVGTKIATGSHSITWYVLEEFEELRGDKIQFQVRADGVSIETLVIGNQEKHTTVHSKDRTTIETVIIGNQEWTTKNLNVSTYRNGDIIPEVKDPREWKNLITGAWCYYDNDPKNAVIYGKLYNWYAVSDPRGLAPVGFHVPTIDELGEIYNLKKPTGFSGLPGGYRNYDGTFYAIGDDGNWWSSSEPKTTNTWSLGLDYSDGSSYRSNGDGTNGYSVRCLKD